MIKNREIFHCMFVIKKAYDSMWDDIAEKYSLTRVEIDVIAFLSNNPELDTASNVVEYRMMAKSHVSKAVDRLISRGYLVGEKDSRDRRQVHLRLTEAASGARADIARRQREFITHLQGGISREDFAYFTKVAEKLAENAASSGTQTK